MKNQDILPYIKDLKQRLLEEGGFASKPGGTYRPDATAWAIVALSAAGTQAEELHSSRMRLADHQLNDGRVAISPKHLDVIWPTPLAVIAFHDDKEFSGPESNAIAFLLNTAGHHWVKRSNDPIGHDPAVRGWPWVINTHSWLEPTALTVVALRISGHGKHLRTNEAKKMLLDRQLPQGGWNYGNKSVFGKELRPMPETTGIALAALGGQTAVSSLEQSIIYLQNNIGHMQTPLSLGWGILGLSACGGRPRNANDAIIQCLEKQDRYGIYNTVTLSLMIIAFLADKGIVDLIHRRGR